MLPNKQTALAITIMLLIFAIWMTVEAIREELRERDRARLKGEQ